MPRVDRRRGRVPGPNSALQPADLSADAASSSRGPWRRLRVVLSSQRRQHCGLAAFGLQNPLSSYSVPSTELRAWPEPRLRPTPRCPGSTSDPLSWCSLTDRLTGTWPGPLWPAGRREGPELRLQGRRPPWKRGARENPPLFSLRQKTPLRGQEEASVSACGGLRRRDEEGPAQKVGLRGPLGRVPNLRVPIFPTGSHLPPLLPTQAGRRRGSVMAGVQEGLGGCGQQRWRKGGFGAGRGGL